MLPRPNMPLGPQKGATLGSQYGNAKEVYEGRNPDSKAALLRRLSQFNNPNPGPGNP